MSHGLQQDGLRLGDSLLEADAGRRLEGHLVGVNGMIGAVVHCNTHIDHGVTGKHAVLHGLLDALVDGRDEAARDVATNDLVHELVAVAGVGLDAQPAVAKLSGTAGLLLVTALGGRNATDGLAVGDAQLDRMGGDAGAVLQAVKQDADLCLADCGDDGLAGVLVALDLERGICVGRLVQEVVELALGAALVGLDGDAVERVGEAELRRLHLAGDGEGVAGHGLQLGDDNDVAGRGLLDVRGLAAGHAVQVAKALALARTRVDELQAGSQRTSQDLEEGESAVLRVVERLEDEGDGAIVVRGDVQLLAVD